ncbi:MAG: Maf family protein, partial [Promethearchaeota archaeon]
DASKILQILSGNVHKLITGVAIYDSESENSDEFFDLTEVKFAKLDPDEIEMYLSNSDEYKNRAGAYSLSEQAGLFIERINGSPSNVIGLPMDKIYSTLKKFGINLLKISMKGNNILK